MEEKNQPSENKPATLEEKKQAEVESLGQPLEPTKPSPSEQMKNWNLFEQKRFPPAMEAEWDELKEKQQVANEDELSYDDIMQRLKDAQTVRHNIVKETGAAIEKFHQENSRS